MENPVVRFRVLNFPYIFSVINAICTIKGMVSDVKCCYNGNDNEQLAAAVTYRPSQPIWAGAGVDTSSSRAPPSATS
jgi:hypothetical protein